MDENKIENNASNAVSDATMHIQAQSMAKPVSSGYAIGTLSELYEDITSAYVFANPLNIYELKRKRFVVAAELLDEINTTIDITNAAICNASLKWPALKKLPATCAARLILETKDIRLIKMSTSAVGGIMVAIRDYDGFGNPTGIWILDVDTKDQPGVLRGLIRSVMSLEASECDVDKCRKAILEQLYDDGLVYPEGWNKDFIVFFNGVWNGVTRDFTYFTDPDYEQKYGSYTFLSKMDTSWNPLANEKTYFRALDFLRSVMPDGQLGDIQFNAMLHSIQFMLRRYSGKEGNLVELVNDAQRAAGHGGKSTLLEFVLGMIEHGICTAYAARTDQKMLGRNNGTKVALIPIDKWSEAFALTEIIGAWAILSDDAKDVALDDDAVKAIARCQGLLINRKHKDMIKYIPHLVAVIALNGVLRFKDKKDSMFTHQLLYAMDKSFTDENGMVDKNIKAKYIAEEETWEWLAHYVATQVEWLDDYPEDIVASMRGNVEHMKRQNIPTFRFLDDVMEGLQRCNRIPLECIFDLYYGWREVHGVSYPLDDNRFAADVAQWVKDHSDAWEIYPVRYDRLHTKKEYEVMNTNHLRNGRFKKVGTEQVSELALLTEFINPAVLEYGAPTKEGGQRRTINIVHDSVSHTDRATGTFCDGVLRGKKFKILLVNKNRVTDYCELDDAGDVHKNDVEVS